VIKVPRFICLCEEVTLEEIEKVVKEEDIHDLETLKRRLRVGMGHCGGRYCLNLLLRMHRKIFGRDIRYLYDYEIPVPSARPPTKPTRVEVLLNGGDNE